ncbi:MAG TPA: hypothetical protein VJR89_10940, partial [Polyangiales bacterium]|nr:hypothetical protein [Polyangiales bacterium]
MHHWGVRWGALAACSLLGMTACGDECQRLQTCDIRDRDCQRAILDWVGCVRGGDASLPQIRIGSEQDYLDRTRAEAPDDEELAEQAAWNRGLARFKLAPAIYDRDEQQRDFAAEIGAVYFSDDKDILVIDRGDPLSDDSAVAGLVHELVHAQQDVEHRLTELRKRLGKTFDAGLALRGLTEGEAVLYQSLALVELAGYAPGDVDWEKWFSDWRSEQLEDADADETPYLMSYVRFPYAFGGGFVAQAWLERGREAVDALYARPPLQTRSLLFPTPQLELADTVREVRAHCRPTLAEGFEVQGFATLGSWLAYMYQRRVKPGAQDPWFLAQHLAADCFAVQRHESGQLAASWHVSMLASTSGNAWPGADELSFVRRSISGSGHDAFLIGTELVVPPDPGAIEWGEIEADE